MRGPLFQAQATLHPTTRQPRLVPGWRPTISPIVASTSSPDFSVPALGIAFTSGPGQTHPGNTFSCAFHVLAWPDPLCDRIAVGVEFAFLEGTAVVGVGMVTAVDHADGA
jgi:hypothetical protein